MCVKDKHIYLSKTSPKLRHVWFTSYQKRFIAKVYIHWLSEL